MDHKSDGNIRIFYDGSCPMCRREIAFIARQRGAEVFVFEDISAKSGDIAEGVSCQQAMARMHVQTADGKIVSGARAFLVMWGALPRFRWAAKALSIPPIPTVLEGGYRLFLKIRPSLQALARKNEATN